MNALEQIELMEVEELQAQEQRFQITDLESLNWAFRKISALKSEEKNIKQLANVERERINSWEQKELNPIHNSISFFEGLIQNYHSQQLAENPKAKTISTPYGKSKTRKSVESVDKGNEEQLLQYAIENNLNDVIKQSIKWADLKKALKIVEVNGQKVVLDNDGQVVPGVTVKPESISYSVEV